MIHDKNRAGWFGASDTKYIIGSFDTKTFERWWLVKLGVVRGDFQNKYTLGGTHWEHKILDAVHPECRKDKQIKIRGLRLRVNLDGNTRDCIYEVKTHKGKFALCKAYRTQVIVQMFASGIRRAKVISYRMEDEEYDNYFLPVDMARIAETEVVFDREFITETYLPRLIYLRNCLKKGVTPNEIDLRKAQNHNGLHNVCDDFIISRCLRKQGRGEGIVQAGI